MPAAPIERRGRRVRQNDPSLLILLSLAEGDKHGHALAVDIAEVAGVRLGPGTLYGAITRLEERGLIEPLAEEGRRRPYRLTGAGLAALDEGVRELRRLAAAGDERVVAAGRRLGVTAARGLGWA
ncbi:MAG TPA: PadR family transcriptional regulator [Acidimicrobiales bacterium]|jgi:DNA-binding PadR family transcriptional regulator|nr:PadR family transcriptional regulator [Acidimicrobiales bacterium]